MKTETDKRFIEFSEKLKKRGIISTYKSFCDSISIAQQVYNDIKAGRRSATIEMIVRTCSTYRVSSDDFLLGRQPSPPRTPPAVVAGRSSGHPNRRTLRPPFGAGAGEISQTKRTENLTFEQSKTNGKELGKERKLPESLPEIEDDIRRVMPVVLELPEGAIDNAVAVPVLPVEAAAGTGAFNMDYHEDTDTLLLPRSFLASTRAARYCIEVRGESMEPTLTDRTRLIIRQLSPAEWGGIRDGAVYVVTDREGRTFVKRIRNRLRERGALLMMSDNPDRDHYRTFELSESEIQHIWRVELYISDRIPPTTRRNRLRDELEALRDRMDELELKLR